MQRWLDMVDWRAARVGSKPDQKRQGIEWYLERGTGQVRSNHPARTWVEGQEKQAARGTQAKGTLDVTSNTNYTGKHKKRGSETLIFYFGYYDMKTDESFTS